MGEDHGDGRDRQRLTVPEAATVLEVTVDAVRGRVRRGTIDHERDETGKVYVWVALARVSGAPGGAASRRPPPTVEGPSRNQGTLELVEVLKAQLEAEREANRENRRIIAGLIQRVPELEPPREEPHGPETVSETSEGVDAPTGQVDRETGVQRRERSWWRRFFGFE
jgi:hypothetical protein